MIVDDPRGVPQTVASIAEIEILEKCLIGMLGMQYDPSDYLIKIKSSESLASWQLECINLLTTMELEKFVTTKRAIVYFKKKTSSIILTDRDVALFNAIEAWTQRRFVEAHQHLQEVLAKYPQDTTNLICFSYA